MFRLAIATACLQATLSAPANVLFIIVDNFRPEIGAYGVQDVRIHIYTAYIYVCFLFYSLFLPLMCHAIYALTPCIM